MLFCGRRFEALPLQKFEFNGFWVRNLDFCSTRHPSGDAFFPYVAGLPTPLARLLAPPFGARGVAEMDPRRGQELDAVRFQVGLIVLGQAIADRVFSPAVGGRRRPSLRARPGSASSPPASSC
jgi:hypothetical protein